MNDSLTSLSKLKFQGLFAPLSFDLDINSLPGWLYFSSKLSELKFNHVELSSISTAYRIAYYAHKDAPPRASGEPYFWHPWNVALYIIEIQKKFHVRDWKSIVIALLHDVVEDAKVSHRNPKLLRQEIDEQLGTEIAYGTLLITRYTEKEEHYRVLARCDYWRSLFVKTGGDRSHNLDTLSSVTSSRQVAKISETRTHFPPLLPRFQFLIEREVESGKLDARWQKVPTYIHQVLAVKIAREEKRLKVARTPFHLPL